MTVVVGEMVVTVQLLWDEQWDDWKSTVLVCPTDTVSVGTNLIHGKKCTISQ